MLIIMAKMADIMKNTEPGKANESAKKIKGTIAQIIQTIIILIPSINSSPIRSKSGSSSKPANVDFIILK